MTSSLDNIVLGIPRRRSGAFEHAWGLAQNLAIRGLNSEYYSNWFDVPPQKVDLKTQEIENVDIKSLQKRNGIFHLHSHTWEISGILEEIEKNKDSRIIYALHAILPYYYLSGEEKLLFLEGKLSQERVLDVIQNKMNDREKMQLRAMERADHLVVISEGHKSALRKLGVQKPISVLENVVESDLDNAEILRSAREMGVKFRESLEAENVLLYCGRLYPKKGSLWLLDGFNKIRQEYPSTKMILLGVDPSKENSLIEYGLSKENLSGIVTVPWIDKSQEGAQERLLQHYFATDVLVQPMITEGLFSKTVIDAMKLNVPTITCRSPYTIGGSFGADEIYESFIYMKENPAEVQRKIRLAADKVGRENNWDYYIDKLDQIINS